MKSVILNVATVATTLAAVSMVALYVRSASSIPKLPADQQPRIVEDWRRYSAEGVRLGPSNPRVTVVEFADFRCPHCARAALTLRELRRSFPEDVSLVHRHLPLTRVSRAAARTAECGHRAGVFQEIRDRLFAQQDSLGVKPWTRFAWESGIRDTVEFARCLGDTTVAAVVVRDLKVAAELDIWSVPTLLVNERLYTGSPGLKYLRGLVEGAARKSQDK